MYFIAFLDYMQLLKHVDLRKTPSLEFGLMLTFSYLPYALAEGIHLSGKLKIPASFVKFGKRYNKDVLKMIEPFTLNQKNVIYG